MNQFQGSHILSVSQLNLDNIQTIFDVAKRMTPYALREKRTRVLDGAILSNLFFEPSTRTRVSFGCAFDLLGGRVAETVGMANSSLSKGESLYDSARVLSSYSDVIAMRHPQSFSVKEFAEGSRVPVINGGDGANEHPTQALLDLFTIKKELNSNGLTINGMHIAMVGDLKFGRTVHSLSRLLCMYKNISFTLISPKELAMPDSVIADIENAGHRVTITDQLEGNLHDADILYLTRIQEERFPSQEEADKYRGKFRLNSAIYTKNCKSNTVIMHPLPRDSRAQANELDNDLNNHPYLAIFRQADNGLLIRMALFALTLGVADQLEKYECPVNWYSRKADR
ncbi:aspartate carbamoyltransferase [Shewanella dokdonensis]|uniref:Aspartate carbamoyltransferase n=1 Tax=Shewanella dokdonensis TaxID=712036 RepID=A0ABX8DFX3_9GAMM|nr:aspartate carbamoyltransferase [Shewanella dokdonensis]MCL1073844.1 aspartate carbamoyltransferase [Shewanella dokdonensis]QVK23628.1 aspartate carbamoyltransferase [Shewanella dokdonensis]